MADITQTCSNVKPYTALLTITAVECTTQAIPSLLVLLDPQISNESRKTTHRGLTLFCLFIGNLVFNIPLHAARRAMAAACHCLDNQSTAGLSRYTPFLVPDWNNRS